MNDRSTESWLLESVSLKDLDRQSQGQALARLSDFVWALYRREGRSFPWRETDDPYRILLSELMLQQTQTERVLPKYEQFLSLWPDFEAMASSSLLEVLSAWKGLGYNRRALAVRTIAQKSAAYGWTLPNDYHALLEFPMIGPATAAAVMAFSHHEKSIYLETNIRRVLIHQFHPNEQQVGDTQLRQELAQLLELQTDYKHWYYALMDYGVILKKQVVNPNRRSAHYSRQSKFEDSDRQIRGMLLLVFTEQGPQDFESLCRQLPFERERIGTCLSALEAEGFVSLLSSVSEEPSRRYGIPT